MRLRAGACAGILAVGILGGCSSSTSTKVPSAVADKSKPCVDRYIALFNAVSVKDAKSKKIPKALEDAAKKLETQCPTSSFGAKDYAKLLKGVDPEIFAAFTGQDPQTIKDQAKLLNK